MNKETRLERIKRDIASSDSFGYLVDDDAIWLVEEVERLTKVLYIVKSYANNEQSWDRDPLSVICGIKDVLVNERRD